MTFPRRTCVACGRLVLDGTNRCDLHKLPVRTEAERLVTEPHRAKYRDPEYRRNRRIVLKRADGHCESCGGGFGEPGPRVDHKTPLSQGGTNDLSNLWALCVGCHKAKTASDRRRHAKG